MTIASKIAKSPALLHSYPASMREAIAVDVAYKLREAFKKKKKKDKGREKIALRVLKFCNELARLDLVLAGSVVGAFGEDTGSQIFPTLVKTARRYRTDPEVEPFLRTLKSLLIANGRTEAGNALLRDTQIKEAIWAGETLEQIQTRLDRFDIAA